MIQFPGRFAVAILATAIALPIEADAEVTTIDFDSATPGDILQDDYLEDGFRISVVSDHYDLAYHEPGNGHMNIDTFKNANATVRLDFFGSSFNFLRFDVLWWLPNSGELPLDEIASVKSSAGGYAEITGEGVMDFSGTPWRGVSWIEFSVDDPNFADEGLGDWFGFDNIRLSVAVPVTIDIQPGSDPNCFNINGSGVIPVAVLGSDAFDVTLVDTYSLTFGGLDVRVTGRGEPQCGLKDINLDGKMDLVCKFSDSPEDWEPGDGVATLTASLFDGTEIEGADSICIVP